MPSTISHSQAGKGVFVCSDKPIVPGTLLGFFPGVLYTKEFIPKANNDLWKTELPYLLRYKGDAIFHQESLLYPPYKLGYGIEEYLLRLKNENKTLPWEVPSHYINPYALGHFINHPPPDTAPNACLIDFEIPECFFPSFLLNYYPYMRHSIYPSAPPKALTAVGIVAIQHLHNQEIFINYGNERFSENFIPDWLHEPPDNMPIANYLCKEDCLNDYSRLTKLLLKWDDFSFSEIDKIQREMQKDKEKRAKEALNEPKLFEKYYQK